MLSYLQLSGLEANIQTIPRKAGGGFWCGHCLSLVLSTNLFRTEVFWMRDKMAVASDWNHTHYHELDECEPTDIWAPHLLACCTIALDAKCIYIKRSPAFQDHFWGKQWILFLPDHWWSPISCQRNHLFKVDSVAWSVKKINRCRVKVLLHICPVRCPLQSCPLWEIAPRLQLLRCLQSVDSSTAWLKCSTLSISFSNCEKRSSDRLVDIPDRRLLRQNTFPITTVYSRDGAL